MMDWRPLVEDEPDAPAWPRRSRPRWAATLRTGRQCEQVDTIESLERTPGQTVAETRGAQHSRGRSAIPESRARRADLEDHQNRLPEEPGNLAR
jgi:hypothetical protein